jgi:hypothetical protein
VFAIDVDLTPPRGPLCTVRPQLSILAVVRDGAQAMTSPVTARA